MPEQDAGLGTMLKMILNPDDSLETVLPTVELAMETGDVCCISNIKYLSQINQAALVMLAKSENLMDSETGQVFHAHPGFHLFSVDDDNNGVERILLM